MLNVPTFYETQIRFQIWKPEKLSFTNPAHTKTVTLTNFVASTLIIEVKSSVTSVNVKYRHEAIQLCHFLNYY